MADRLEAITVRKGKDGKNFWTRVGVAFPNQDGGWSVFLDAIPSPSPVTDSSGKPTGDLQYKVILSPPRPRQNTQAREQQGQQSGWKQSPSEPAKQPPIRDEMNDEIPF